MKVVIVGGVAGGAPAAAPLPGPVGTAQKLLF